MKNNKNKQKPVEQAEQNGQKFSPKIEKIYKTILRVMSYFIGAAIVAILILPLFEVPLLDAITQYLFRAGLLSLVLVIFIELFGNTAKSWLSMVIEAA